MPEKLVIKRVETRPFVEIHHPLIEKMKGIEEKRSEQRNALSEAMQGWVDSSRILPFLESFSIAHDEIEKYGKENVEKIIKKMDAERKKTVDGKFQEYYQLSKEISTEGSNRHYNEATMTDSEFEQKVEQRNELSKDAFTEKEYGRVARLLKNNLDPDSNELAELFKSILGHELFNSEEFRSASSAVIPFKKYALTVGHEMVRGNKKMTEELKKDLKELKTILEECAGMEGDLNYVSKDYNPEKEKKVKEFWDKVGRGIVWNNAKYYGLYSASRMF